jgi:hypothetical protein
LISSSCTTRRLPQSLCSCQYAKCQGTNSFTEFHTPFRRERELRLSHAQRSLVLRLPTPRPELRPRFKVLIFYLGTLCMGNGTCEYHEREHKHYKM